jgi:tetratricopeptide (TPR) repeat protein
MRAPPSARPRQVALSHRYRRQHPSRQSAHSHELYGDQLARSRLRAQARSETKASPVSVPARAQVDAQAIAEQAVNAMFRGDFTDSLAKFQQAIDASPRFAAAHRGKGLVLERLGRRKEAATAFKQYLRLSPNAQDTEKIRRRVEALER